MGYQRARTVLCDVDDCDARLVVEKFEQVDQRMQLTGWTKDGPLDLCPAHPATRVAGIEEALSADELLEVPIRAEDLTYVTFRPAVPHGDYTVRLIHQPTGKVVEASGPSALECRATCLRYLREQLQ